jgi:hypothetical protein
METINTLFALLAAMLVRLAIPILITALAVYFLKKLDEHWQTEGEVHPLPVQKPECWKVRECPPQARSACPGYLSPLPCWQAYRLPNGYLREECLTCEVFRSAPLPAYA